MAKGLIFDDWGAQETQPLPQGHRRLFPPFRRQAGNCFSVGLPGLFGGPSDTAADPRRSRLELYEDGRPLGPRHAIYEEIVEHGGGLYDHFDSALFFSTSDNTDPTRNGRVYTFSVGDPTPKVLGVGGCHMNGTVRHLHNRHLIDVKGLGMGVAYSPLEGRRLIERLLGQRTEPVGLDLYAVSTEDCLYELEPDLGAVDVLLFEITAHTDILIDGLCLNRCAIITHFLGGLEKLGPAAHAVGMRWFSNGLLKGQEIARAEAAAALLHLLPGTALDTEAARTLIHEARGVRESLEEMEANTRVIQALVGAPRTILIYGPNVFFPDGRWLSWHAGLDADVAEVARHLDVPMVHIGDMVGEKGVPYAVIEDMVHHTEPFMGDIGDAALAAAQRHYGPLRPLAGLTRRV